MRYGETWFFLTFTFLRASARARSHIFAFSPRLRLICSDVRSVRTAIKDRQWSRCACITCTRLHVNVDRGNVRLCSRALYTRKGESTACVFVDDECTATGARIISADAISEICRDWDAMRSVCRCGEINANLATYVLLDLSHILVPKKEECKRITVFTNMEE